MHVEEGTKEYDYMWYKLSKLSINRDNEIPQMCENKGELWQYMGTCKEDKKIVHQFRHRYHPKTLNREYRNIRASDGFKFQD